MNKEKINFKNDYLIILILIIFSLLISLSYHYLQYGIDGGLVLANQIKKGLKSIKSKSNIIVAYEPVWSIGTGLIPKPDDLAKSINFIKKKFGKKSPKVLYGGSVNNINISELKKISLIDGFLIGAASQDSNKFIDIIKKTYI